MPHDVVAVDCRDSPVQPNEDSVKSGSAEEEGLKTSSMKKKQKSKDAEDALKASMDDMIDKKRRVRQQHPEDDSAEDSPGCAF